MSLLDWLLAAAGVYVVMWVLILALCHQAAGLEDRSLEDELQEIIERSGLPR